MGNAVEHFPAAVPLALSPAPRDEEAERRRFWNEELLAAVEQGNLHQKISLDELAEAALREGACVDARDAEGGGGGWTALHLAASRGDAALVRLLLEAGAHPARRDAYGWTPLHFAASTDFALGVRLLACAGAELEARDALGCTPLHLAARWDRQAALLELLRLGADARAQDARGLTPYERAPTPRVQRLLRSQGAAHAGSRTRAHSAHAHGGHAHVRAAGGHSVRYRVSLDGSEDVELPKSPFDKAPDFFAWRILRRNKSSEGVELATSQCHAAETKKNEHSAKSQKEKQPEKTSSSNIEEQLTQEMVSDIDTFAMQEKHDLTEGIQMKEISKNAEIIDRESTIRNKGTFDCESKSPSEQILSN